MEVQDVTEMEFLDLGEQAPENNENNDNHQENNDPNPDQNESQESDDSQENDQPAGDQQGDNGQPDPNDNETPDPNETGDGEGEQGEQGDEGDQSDGDEEVSLFSTIVENSGVEFEDDELNTILETEETDEGLNKVAGMIAEKKAEKRFESLMEQYPNTAKLLQYEMHGGDAERFYETHFPEVDYNQVEIQEDDVQTQKQVVAQSLKLQGLDQEDIDASIQDLEDAGILERNAQRSLKALQRHQQKQVEEFEQEQQQLIEQRQQEAQQQYEQTTEIIQNGEIEGVKIPEDKRDAFHKYVFEPIDEQGTTQAQKDAQELGVEQRLLMAYLNFSGHNLDGLIDSQAKNKKAIDLRDGIKKSNSKENLKGKGSQGSQKPGKPEDIVSPFSI